MRTQEQGPILGAHAPNPRAKYSVEVNARVDASCLHVSYIRNGSHTRPVLNASDPGSKASKVDKPPHKHTQPITERLGSQASSSASSSAFLLIPTRGNPELPARAKEGLGFRLQALCSLRQLTGTH